MGAKDGVWICRDCKARIVPPLYAAFEAHAERTGHTVFAPVSEAKAAAVGVKP